MRRRLAQRAFTLALGACILTAVVQIHPFAQTAAPTTPTLRDLAGLDGLRADFNRDRDAIRVVLLLSPT